MFSTILIISIISFINIIYLYMFICANDVYAKIFLFPFCLLALIVLVEAIIERGYQNYELAEKIKKIYKIVFIIFWDIALIISTIGILFYIDKMKFPLLIFIIPFWIVGIYKTIDIIKTRN